MAYVGYLAITVADDVPAAASRMADVFFITFANLLLVDWR